MKKQYISILALLFLFSCRSEFEKVRERGNPEDILALAHKSFESEEYFKANTLYDLVRNQYRGTKEAELLYYRFAQTHYHMRQYVSAGFYFENFAKVYANSEYAEEAQFMVGNSYYALSPAFRLEQSHTQKAIDAYQRFANFNPTSERVAECNKRIDELRKKLEDKAFDSAILYFNVKNYKAALHSFENLLKDYPESSRNEEIRYLIVKASFDLAANSRYELKKERFRKVGERFELFNKKFPNSSYTNELRNLVDKSKEEIKNIKDV